MRVVKNEYKIEQCRNGYLLTKEDGFSRKYVFNTFDEMCDFLQLEIGILEETYEEEV